MSARSKIYLAIDGDSVGSIIEKLILTNDETTLEKFSIEFRDAMAWLCDQLISNLDCKLILVGGDNILASLLERNELEAFLDGLFLAFHTKVKITLSVGIGKSPREAHLALKYAKSSGKNQLYTYEQLLKSSVNN